MNNFEQFSTFIPDYHLHVTVSKERDFRYILAEDTYVVWLAKANRFLQLKEPAFFVFEAWAGGKEPEAIAVECTARYDLPLQEASRFTGEIISETEKLYKTDRKDAKTLSNSATRPPGHLVSKSHSHLVSTCTCRIGGKYLRFIYGNDEPEELFRPLFKQFEVNAEIQESVEGHSLKIFEEGGKYCIRVDAREPQQFEPEETEYFQGAVLMEVLNILHGKTRDDWMGVFHASAVSDGKAALLLLGGTGSGKSTLAALMVANGLKLVSDDFVPVSRDSQRVFPLPSSVSVKKGSLTLLEKSFPELMRTQTEGEEEYEQFLHLPQESLEWSPVKAKALVFINYDPDIPFRLVKISNPDMLNNLLKQSWIQNRPEAVEKFLEWYFDLPVYSLAYSNNGEAIKGLRDIFEDNNEKSF